MDLDRVSEVLADEPAYRSRQVWEWAARGTRSYGEMTNVSTAVRARLDEEVPVLHARARTRGRVE